MSLRDILERLSVPQHFFAAISITLTLYVLWANLRPLPPLQGYALFVLLVFVCLFTQEWARQDRGAAWRAVDFGLMVLTGLVFGYVVLNHEAIYYFVGVPPNEALILGVLAIFIALYATVRTVGWALTLIVASFLAYGFWGEYLPRSLGGHGGFTLNRIITVVYLSENGLFGFITSVLFHYIFLFVLFGKVLQHTGALHFVMNLAQAAVGRFRGGPALVSVVASAMMGSVSGSAVANVMVTGSMTIPLMKRIGFKPHVAAAVEAAASTGGQVMPPIMGAAAFLMIEFLGISYLEVIKAALLPAILYFVGVMVGVYVYARRAGVGRVENEQLPSLREALLGPGSITFIAGIGALVILLLRGYSPTYAALYGMAAMLVVSLFSRERLTPRKLLAIFHEAPRDFVPIAVASICVSMLVAIVLLTGLGTRLAGLILDLTGRNLIPLLFMTMIGAEILGIGMPTTIAYILVVVMLVPALVDLGVLPLVAHLFVLFCAITSMITPPVGLATYAAAAIAGCSFWRAGILAFVLALPAYLLPLAFVLDNHLVLIGSAGGIVREALTALVGVTLLGIGLVGPLTSRSFLERIARGVITLAALLLVFPGHITNISGIALAILGLVLLKIGATTPLSMTNQTEAH